MNTIHNSKDTHLHCTRSNPFHGAVRANNRKDYRLQKIFFLLCLLCCMTVANGKVASAASSYQKIFPATYSSGEIVKHGKYYFKLVSGNVYMSQSKNGAYVKTPLDYNAYGNKSQSYYLNASGKILYQYNFQTRKSKKIKRILSNKKDLYAQIRAIHGKNIYISCGGEEYWRYDTYVYNISKKKVTKKIKDCNIVMVKGKYAISEPAYRTDVSGSPIFLYKFTSSGLKKIKKLSDYGWANGFVGNKFYYTNYPIKSEDYDYYLMTTAELYRCNLNGTGKKKIATLKTKNEYDQLIVQKVTSKYCVYWCSSGTYKYTYKTKKTKKISS